jgi:peptide/nickel transport system permease protein|tara:strand:- start:2359 stop:3213 length:855 start_codon:yes stop_codon:yes gene_type:complete
MFILKGFINFCRSSVLASVAIVILIGVIFMAVFADIITPHDPLKAYFTDLKKPPSAEFLMGTDHIGRDVLSRIILGSRITIYVAIMSIFFGNGIGFIWGVTTGFFGGKLDLFSQRILDILMAFPTVILALLVLASIGAGLTSVIIAIAISSVPNATRIIRSVSLSVSEMAYVDAARAIGANPVRIMFKHIAPQCIAPFMVIASAGLGVAIFAEAALSFLGMGIPPPTPTWGNMLGGVLANVFKPPYWLVIAPGVAITLTVLAFNLLGDSLRDYLDPRLRGRLEN